MICDLAETYQILNYKGLPVRLLATLVSGLRADSRIVQELTGVKDTNKTLLLAQMVDGINTLAWVVGGDKDHRPKSVYELLVEKEEAEKPAGFASGAAYEQARAKMIEEINNGG